MKKRVVGTGIILVAISGAIAIHGLKSKPSIQAPKTPDTLFAPWQSPSETIARYPQISLNNQTKEEAVRIWLDRLQQDKEADWKVPIEFYGKVVDEKSKGLANAHVHFRWTNLSRKGSGDADALTDEQGFFRLTGVEGKRLSVSVEKEGYYASETASFRSFEFSNPGEQIYYEPDEHNPVIFRLQSRGPGVNLIRKSIKVFLPDAGSRATVDLQTGQITPSGQLELRSWKPWPPKPVSPHYDWRVELEINGGGFSEAPEEFAFEAPETAYNPLFAIDMSANRGQHWNVSAEKTLYFKFGEPQKYGRLTLRTDGNSRYVFIDYVLNPFGSRNLEDASPDRRSR